MLPDIPKASWRPEIEGWAEDILPFYAQLARELSQGATMVEIGVAHGRSAVFLAELLTMLGRQDVALWCVDFWPGEEFEKILWTLERTAKAPRDLLRIVRCDGVQAARLFDEASVDVVFEDSDHSYEGAARTIAAWRSKVKPGGTFAGHDYSREDWPGVVRAVDEAFADREIRRPTRSVWEVRL
jgi:cephalosporin hydroxylase